MPKLARINQWDGQLRANNEILLAKYRQSTLFSSIRSKHYCTMKLYFLKRTTEVNEMKWSLKKFKKSIFLGKFYKKFWIKLNMGFQNTRKIKFKIS